MEPNFQTRMMTWRYDRDYVPPQTTTDVELQADNDVEDEELDEIIEDERHHNDRSDDAKSKSDESENDEESESTDDDSHLRTVKTRNKMSQSQKAMSHPQKANDSNNVETEGDNVINRRIDDVMNEFEETVLPGAEEVMEGHVQEIRRSGRTRQEVERLTYLQTQHLEPEHNIFAQDVSKEKLTYNSTEAMVLATYIDEIDYLMKDMSCMSQQHLLAKRA